MTAGAFIPSLSHNCIIEEQEHHIVVAIRIPKATLAENMALFAALADRCDVPEERPAVLRETRSRRDWRSAALWACMFSVGLLGG